MNYPGSWSITGETVMRGKRRNSFGIAHRRASIVVDVRLKSELERVRVAKVGLNCPPQR